MELDAPKDTYQVWAWLLYTAPADGRVYFDDASLEVLGPALGESSAGARARTPAKPAPTRKPRPKGAAAP